MRGLCINDARNRNKWRRFCKEWSTPVNWKDLPLRQNGEEGPDYFLQQQNAEFVL